VRQSEAKGRGEQTTERVKGRGREEQRLEKQAV
jgi:hypothetical protein